MSLYHFHVTQISRGKGQTAVSAAAYRSGEKLHDSYYGEDPDYRKKGGVLHSEIMLPEYVPKKYFDRETLWNELEHAEKHPQAQLAYSFDIALQNEFSYEENLELTRRFVKENFVDKGMIVDLAIHNPDKGEGGIQNPHFHVMSPIRPIDLGGSWGAKQRREYLFDEQSNPVLDEKGRHKFNAVSTTDWGAPETLRMWRKNWADMVNSKFEEKGLPNRIDERSYEERGIDLIPTIHEGPAVMAMEARGIRTRKGDLNRFIKETNKFIKALGSKIASISKWIAEVRRDIAQFKEEKEIEQLKYLPNLIRDYFEARNAGAYSTKAKSNNLKEYMKIVDFLSENSISTLEDLDVKVDEMYGAVGDVRTKLNEISSEQSSIKEILRYAGIYAENRHAYDELRTIKNRKKSDAFKESHHAELSLYYMARRQLKEAFDDGRADTVDKLNSRLEVLEKDYSVLYEQYKELKSEANQAYSIKKAVDSVYRQKMRELGLGVNQSKNAYREER